MTGFFLLSLSHAAASASPTSNEFEVCHKMAAALLVQCLNDIPGYVDDDCWKSARELKDGCYHDVFASHRPQTDGRDAIRKALEQERAGK